ncbi:hypothetical protein [Salana multivorans]
MSMCRSNETPKPLELIGSDSPEWSDRPLLNTIDAALTDLENAEQRLLDSIRAAHQAGESWGMIGMVLGISWQAAHRKYAVLVRDEESSPEV